ncbi:Bacterial membrane protein YfhO [Planococcus massiliensis]|uniref:Bacterial membrane protein YfhO n=1 Tax=Planococcus massiliensis TaxID=1499687 RepID=A0A098EKT1_9BACL|nr:YfhO family protein [Planococcus massiliensis]CEG21696.1 Bacterial membrane protein YfhO [Planococcus massiliensis]
MRNRFFHLYLLLGSFFLAILAHAVFLYQWTRSHFMVGIDDGSSQMLPFKKLLYDQYTSGEFFYSFDFGLGAGTFSELSYYFSTSIVFLVSVLFIFLLETIGIVQTTDILFWANAAVFISIIRLTFILFITTRLFMYMKISWLPALLGASVYGISGMYFRHTVYWEFFADAFLWLPLLILGIEKIFREQKPGWFLLAVSISMIDNFYFSYINFLLAAIYIAVRLFIPLTSGETKRLKALWTFLWAGLLGFGISAVSFIPAVYAFLNNHRPAFEQEIDWMDFTDNILFTSRYIVLPAIFVLLLFMGRLYRNRTFRLFAILGAIGVVLHFSPLAASIFNGFSAPQFRWEYFLSLMAGGAIAVGLRELPNVTVKQFLLASLITVFLFIYTGSTDETLKWQSSASILVLISLFMSLLFSFSIIKWKTFQIRNAFIAFLLIFLIGFTNLYQVEKLLETGKIGQVNEGLLTGSEYDDPEIRELLAQIDKSEASRNYRIEWMEGVRNNTPIVQDFRGLSAYSSILNKNLLYFYLYDLEIDMGRESVSRYATLGKRTNLHSMLQGKYIILPKDDNNIPYGFTDAFSSGKYTVYENSFVLPFARTASVVYQEQQLEESPVLAREHAMLTGVVLDGSGGQSELPKAEEKTDEFEIAEADAHYENGILEITGDEGGLDFIRPNSDFQDGDLYISFHLENFAASTGFSLKLNDYSTTRKANDSIYRTFVDDLTLRTEASEKISLRLPKGRYALTNIEIYEEPYEVLKTQTTKESGLSQLNIDGSSVEMVYDNKEKAPYLTAAIPYERGWSAEVNGKEVPVRKANYAFVAVPLEEGKNSVSFSYRPPFFKVSLALSVLSLAVSLFLLFGRKRRP